jgi:hypothetical protein
MVANIADMKQLIFEADDVRRVIEHSINASTQQGKTIGHDPKTGKAITEPVSAPAVLLVHDEGLYLMSNGEPRDIVSGVRSFVAYARGCHPFRDLEWRTNARELVGGDDFSLCLPWALDLKVLLDAGAKTVVLRVRDDALVEIAAG